MQQDWLTRSAPSTSEAERTVLGALLLDPDAMVKVAPILTANDFHDPTYGSIYGAMEKLYEERTPIDFVTVNAALEGEQKIQQLGGSAFLAELAAEVPTASHVEHYAEIVRVHSLRRGIAKLGTTIAKGAMADESKTSDELLEMVEQELHKLSQQGNSAKFLSLKQSVEKRYDEYAKVHVAEDTSEFNGITIGFAALDRLLEGLEPGHLMIVAGRPSMGKTILGGNISCNAAKQGKRVGIFTLEMSANQITDRLYANVIGVEPSKLRKGTLTDEDFDAVGEGIDRLDDYGIYIDDTCITLASIRSAARRLQMEYGLDLLVIDYLQLIQVTDRAAGDGPVERTTYISGNLKSLARELQCPVIALSQLSRRCEQRTPPIPILSDLRESGAIEQDADSVLMLYREGYYKPQSDNPNLTTVYVRKNRDGATGSVDLMLQKEKVIFHAVDTKHISPEPIPTIP